MKLWGIIKKRHKIFSQYTCTLPAHPEEYANDEIYDIMGEICHELDIARPVVLERHVRDFNDFKRAVFAPSDFIEKVDFDAFELELIDDLEKKTKQ